MNIPYPKFSPGEQVGFNRTNSHSAVTYVIGRISYCEYDTQEKRWKYSLDGWVSKFDGEELNSVPKLLIGTLIDQI